MAPASVPRARTYGSVYRPGFSGHKMLLRDRPYWGECGEPFTPGLSRAAVGILLQQPVLVMARDEGPDRAANLLGIAEDPAPHDLLLEGADEPLRHTIGLRLADEGKARRQAEEGDLGLEGVGHKGAAGVVAEQKAAGALAAHKPCRIDHRLSITFHAVVLQFLGTIRCPEKPQAAQCRATSALCCCSAAKSCSDRRTR